MNKEIIKTTVKKELIKNIINSCLISIVLSCIFYLILNTGVKLGSQNETLKEIPSNVIIILIPMLFIICICFYLGIMAGKGYFDKVSKKK